MSKLSMAALCCMCFIALFSCKKNPSGNPSVTVIPKNEMFSGLKNSSQVLTVQAGMAKTAYGKEGTMLNFYPNSFKDKNGNIITNGTITIELVEMYKPGQMISNWASTATTDGSMLQSAGQIYINATKNGEQVSANKYGIGFKQAATSSQPMQLFYGATKNADSMITWTMGDTLVKGTSVNSTVVVIDSTLPTPSSVYYFFDSCDKFTWVNADIFYKYTGPSAKVNVITPLGCDYTNTSVFLSLLIIK